MQFLPASPQSSLTVSIGSHRQRQQTQKAQCSDNDVRTLTQLNAKLRPIETKDKCQVGAQVQNHISETPQSQLSPDSHPPRPTREFLQRRQTQRNEQQNKRAQTQPVNQYLARIRSKRISPSLIQPKQWPYHRRKEYSDTPKRIAHQ
ncbi:hypothetical protein D3C80_1586870 [compost metagenome]